MTDSLCRKHKLADSFIPCDVGDAKLYSDLDVKLG